MRRVLLQGDQVPGGQPAVEVADDRRLVDVELRGQRVDRRPRHNPSRRRATAPKAGVTRRVGVVEDATPTMIASTVVELHPTWVAHSSPAMADEPVVSSTSNTRRDTDGEV